MLNPPVDVALIGTGSRLQTIYKPLFDALKPRATRVAV